MIEEYRKALKLGEKSIKRARDAGQPGVLPALDDILTGDEGMNPVFVGVMEIPLSLVAGTKTRSRQGAFAPDFMPAMEPNSEFAEKWTALLTSQMEEGIRDPIQVYEYMRRFYVLEGNKRVSVSKYVGSTTILAEVRRILPKQTEEPENRQYFEFLKFFEAAPIYEIAFSKEGSYRKLAEMAGQDLDHVWTAEAVKDLKYAFAMFSQVFYASLLEESTKEIAGHVLQIWNEIRLAEQGDEIDLMEAPEEERETPILGLLRRNTVYTPEHPLRAAFIYDSTPELSRWCYSHELGRSELMRRFGGAVDTLRFDSCRTDEQIRKAVEAAAADEDIMVFTTSSNQMQETLRSAIRYPQIRFFNCSVNLSHKAVQAYYPRMYGVKFLLGALAGSLSGNHRIGYRAAYPIYGALADINAFAIGAALTDPKAEIYLSWASMPEQKWIESLADNDIRIVSGPDNIRPESASREFGLYERREDGTIMNLAAPFWNWGEYYDLILRPVVEGYSLRSNSGSQDRAINYWWGMSAGVVDIILSEKLSYYSRKMVNALKNSMILGRMNPFDGELHSRDGVVKEAGTPRLSSEEIIQQVQQQQSNSPGMHPRGAAGSVVVKGVHDVSIRFSKCCNPVPGDDIVGFITRGRGISIHRTDCSNVLNVAEEDKDRIIEASWIENAAQKKEEGFLVEIKIFATDRAGLLNDLTRIFSEKDISILRISSMTSKQGIATLLFGFEVKSREELHDIIGCLQAVRDVRAVKRNSG